MAAFLPDQTATTDWTTLASTIAALLAAAAALVSVGYAQITLAGARRDRQLAQLQRIVELLVKIENAARGPGREWGQNRDLLRGVLISNGWKRKWDACSRLVDVVNPPGPLGVATPAQVAAADEAANLAERAQGEVGQTITALVNDKSDVVGLLGNLRLKLPKTSARRRESDEQDLSSQG